jgi:Bacterial Ig-like domain/Bacterial Ig domain
MKNLKLHALHIVIALGLTACGGGGSPGESNITPVVNQNPVVNPNNINNPNPIVNPSPSPAPNPSPAEVITPTVAFITPASDIYFSGGMNVEVVVTGAPDKVEFYKNGLLAATAAASPYVYYWDNSSEPEGVYTLTAKTIKAGTADVVSAARVVTVDRTHPTLVSRLPASGATNVQRTDEISVTMSEPMLASNVNATTVRLLVGGAEVGSTAVLDATGKKIRIAFNTPPALPATVTVAISGLTDLARKLNDPIADASFLMPAPALGTPTVILTLPYGTITTVYPGRTGGSRAAQVNLRNFTANEPQDPRRLMELLVGDKRLANSFSYQNPDPVKCPIGICYEVNLGPLNSFNNGTLLIKARFPLANGSNIDSAEVPLTIKIPNGAAFATPFGNYWTPEPDNIGVAAERSTPSDFFPPNPATDVGYRPAYGLFVGHQSVAKDFTLGGEASYTQKFPILPGGNTQGAEFQPFFTALVGTTNRVTFPNGDYIRVSLRACKDAQDCTGWNVDTFWSDTQSGILFKSPPYKTDTNYVEVVLTFSSSGQTGAAYINNIFFGY